MFIFDLVKTHKDQPDIAKKICQQKHHIPGTMSIALASM